MEHTHAAQSPMPPQRVNKWEILRELGVARKALGVADRELAVLHALLSFYPANILGGPRRRKKSVSASSTSPELSLPNRATRIIRASLAYSSMMFRAR